jgi:hypothetical protein
MDCRCRYFHQVYRLPKPYTDTQVDTWHDPLASLSCLEHATLMHYAVEAVPDRRGRTDGQRERNHEICSMFFQVRMREAQPKRRGTCTLHSQQMLQPPGNERQAEGV